MSCIGSRGCAAFSAPFMPLIDACIKRCEELKISPTDHLVLVCIATKTLQLWHHRELVQTYPISTAKNGIGQESGTGKTPLGLHRIEEKIGEGADLLSVFESRLIVPEIMASASEGKRYIVARILRLVGLEEGYNKGTRPADKDKDAPICVDSFERYIYIHGTNYEKEVGKEDNTAGCICMKPADVADLFEKTPEGSLVHIFDKDFSAPAHHAGISPFGFSKL